MSARSPIVRSIALGCTRRLAASVLLASVACAARALPPAPVAPATEPAVAIALMLPSQQTVFAQAAEAVRQGFFAAHEAAGKSLAIQMLELEDDDERLAAALDGARQRGVKVIVGPLRRAAVNALVDGGRADVPFVTLNFPDRDAAAPRSMIALGVSVEAEAQYVVRTALANFLAPRTVEARSPRLFVLSGQGVLQRRIAQAYMSALRTAGESPQLVEVGDGGEMATKLDATRHEGVFLALDAREAALLRGRIPRPIPVFGTSLLNVGASATSPAATALAHDLDGVRFVDMPWLVRSDGAGAGGPLPAAPMPADLARLYALGVDAYRVAARWSAGETRFTIDGMTGRLSVDRANGPRVERVPASAVYRNGGIEHDEIGR